MEAVIENRFYDAFLNAFEPPWTGSMSQWWHKHIELSENYSVTGKLDISLSPYLEQPAADVLNPEIETIINNGGVQTFKSGFAHSTLAYLAVNDPGPVILYHQTKDIGDYFAKSRLIPLLKSCKPTAALLAQKEHSATKDLILFNHVACKISGPAETNLHGATAKYVFIEELHLEKEYGASFLKKAFNRSEAFAGRRKIIISSTPGVCGDQLSEIISKGKIYRWAWLCPGCSRFNVWEWAKKREDGTYSGVNWTPVKFEDGKYNYEETGKSARLECHHCKWQTDGRDKVLRQKLTSSGKYICLKSDGDPSIRTYQWPSFVNPAVSFQTKCIEYLQAKHKFEATYLDDDLKTFYQSTLGVEWNARKRELSSKILFADYKIDGIAPNEIPTMGVDYQQKLSARFYVVRNFNKITGASKQIAYGHVNSWDDIERIRIKYNVPIHLCGIDCGYQLDEVAAESMRRAESRPIFIDGVEYANRVGWSCLRGDKKTEWEWADGVRRYYSEAIKIFAGADQPPARMYFWSGTNIKKILQSLRDNQAGVEWLINHGDEDYKRQMYSESLKPGETFFTKDHDDNHFWDCEAMCVTLAMLSGVNLIGAAVPKS